MKKRVLALGILTVMCLSACGRGSTGEATYGAMGDSNSAAGYADGFAGAAVEGWGDSSYTTYDTGYYDPDAVAGNEIDWNTEEYDAITENQFVSVATQPFSTFGADVDTACYTNLRHRIIQDSQYDIPANSIRIEEMVNYFDYDYAEAANGEKFGITSTLCECPWNKDTLLLRVGVKAETIEADKGSNIVFLIDTSGSMDGPDRLGLVQEAFNILQENLTAKDTVSIVTYAGSSEVLLEGAKGDEHQKIQQAVDSLFASGSTNGGEGIITAYDIAQKYFIEGGNNRVILATDGDLNVGVTSQADLTALVEEKRDTGIFLSCLGVGSGNYSDSRMEALADNGNGNYSYIDSELEAKKVLNDELWSTLYTVAKDTKFQIEFNPELVKGYRQIGYENRQMAAEDFADDTKDGGEVGSGQCVTVLYEIVTVDSDYEIPSVESKYGNDGSSVGTGEFSNELLTVNVRYKEPDRDDSKLITYAVTKDMITEMDEDTSWAAGVAQVGMILRDSEFKGTSTYDEVYDRLKQIADDPYKEEFIYVVSLLQRRK